MSQNIPIVPYLIPINEPLLPNNTLTKQLENLDIEMNSNPAHFAMVESVHSPAVLLEMNDKAAQQPAVIENHMRTTEKKSCLFQIVYPQDFNLSQTAYNKRGRPKKKQSDLQLTPVVLANQEKSGAYTKLPKTARTRSGRLVKLPKYIEKDFKKIDISSKEQELQTSDFKRFDETADNSAPFKELQRRKRTISAQFKCPKCSKAYLGKNKMIQHLTKYPDHGPLPEGYQEFNFDVWNYLFDITQRCKPGQRGLKFCEELSNLLHNVQLLKSALFKIDNDSKNSVQIDKVLGNAIGLTPGRYKFDENELYKDVTVFKLITNSNFFKPTIHKSNDKVLENITPINDTKKFKQDSNTDVSNYSETFASNNQKDIDEIVHLKSTPSITDPDSTYSFNEKIERNKQDCIIDKIENDSILPADLLADNLLLHALPNARSSVDDLMLSSVVENSNLLDNSVSSDEVMNVDQFVNERFKNITESDIELTGGSLNLDLPSLELFQFHTS